MIKAGIYGPSGTDSPLRKQLLRLLLRHPDVDLRTVAAPGAHSEPLTELHPVYTGETDLRLLPEPDLDKLDVLFVIDEANLTDTVKKAYADNENMKLIVLGDAPVLRAGRSDEIVYGFAEYNRKALVRGARAAVSPSPTALLLETALFPLAKNWMIPAATITGEEGSPMPLSADDVREAADLLRTIQSDLEPDALKINGADVPNYERMDLRLSMPLPTTLCEILDSYEKAYEDHGFAYVIPGTDGIDEDLRGSNKCLIQLFEDDGKLRINASSDYLTRGNAGNAVHLMNLLFGLHERTGLSI